MRNKIFVHNVLQTPWPLADQSVNTIVTSPPYWGLRNYQHPDQIGQEPTPEQYVDHMVRVFTEAHRVLRDDGTLWLNLADTYWGGKGQSGAGWKGENINSKGTNWASKGETRPQDRTHPFIKPKDLVGIPWTVALALRNAGWYLRQDIIWSKPNPIPESMGDRCTKAHEYIFLLTKSRQYYFDQDAILQPAAPASQARTGQKSLESQDGSDRVPGKPNGPMKAVRRSGNLQRKAATDRGMDNDGIAGNVPWEGDFANKKSVWTVPTKGFDGEFCIACRSYFQGITRQQLKKVKLHENGKDVIRTYCTCGRHDAWIEHFATFPPELIVDAIKAGCPPGGIVLDPFMGAATTGLTSMMHGRDFVGLELNPDYVDLSRHRLAFEFPLFFTL